MCIFFFHANIIRFCNRPFASVEEMNEGIIERWNKSVKPTDTVWSLGDFAFCQYDQIVSILRRLNGNIHMVLGNHDMNIQKNRKALLDEGLVKEIRDYKELKPDGNTICMFHYPQRTWNKAHYGSWHLFGHVHGSMEPLGRSVDVGMDSPYVLGEPVYRPFSYEEVRDFMRNREVIKDFE